MVYHHFHTSHVVDHGKGKNIRLQEKYFEIFHSDLLSGILGNKKSPDFHIWEIGAIVNAYGIPKYKRDQISLEFSINRAKSLQTF